MGEGRSVGFTFYAKDMFDPVARKVAASMDRIRNSLDAVEKSAGRQQRTGEKLKGDWAGFAVNAKRLAATYVSAQTVRHVLSETATAETALLKVMSAIRDPADQAAYSSKIQSVIEANRKLGFSLDEVAESLTIQIQNMGASSRAFATFSAGSKLATAAFLPLASTVDAVTTLTEAYPQLAGKAGRAAQILFSTRQLTKDFGGLVQTLPQVTQLSERAGLTPERQMALFSVLANEAKSPGQAGSAMQEIVKTLADLGTPAFRSQLAKNKVRGFPSDLATAGLEKQLSFFAAVAQQKPQALSSIGISGPASTLLRTLTKEDIGKIASIEQAITSDAGKNTMGAAFDRVQSSLSKDFSALGASLGKLEQVMGSELTPAVNKLSSILGGVAGAAASPSGRAAVHAFLTKPPATRASDRSFIGDVLSAPLDAAIAGIKASQGGADRLDPGARPKG